MSKPITIVGGGLAGLTLGIGLRQRGVPVTVWEAGRYPRHRVCGEFISGRGLESLARLGLRAQIEKAGAVSANTAAFFSPTNSTPPRKLPSPALCLSRRVLDDFLAAEFRALGGELRAGERWHGNAFGEGAVRATGRRAQAQENGARWFGLKVHARNVALAADLEMHVAPNGYVGLCHIGGGAANVCGLFRRAQDMAGASHELLRGRPGSPLRERLESAEFDESSFCAVAGLSLRPHRAIERDECCLGDAITMIPPVTGNGMSMAFESAEMAIEPLATWSAGIRSWSDAKQTLARRCDAAFARRLTWARWLQALVLSPALQTPLVFLAARSEWFCRLWFERTR
jgi:flavin-dependent dehydrogenase